MQREQGRALQALQPAADLVKDGAYVDWIMSNDKLRQWILCNVPWLHQKLTKLERAKQVTEAASQSSNILHHSCCSFVKEDETTVQLPLYLSFAMPAALSANCALYPLALLRLGAESQEDVCQWCDKCQRDH